MKTLGERIKETREKSGLSRKNVATSLDVSSETVARWERDERSPDALILVKLAAVLGVTATFLLGEPEAVSTPRSERTDDDDIFTLPEDMAYEYLENGLGFDKKIRLEFKKGMPIETMDKLINRYVDSPPHQRSSGSSKRVVGGDAPE